MRSRRDWVRGLRHDPVAYSVFAGYVAVSSIVLWRRRARWTPERTLLAASAVASCAVPLPPLLWRWLPTALSPLMFAELRGFQEQAAARAHTTGPITADEWLLRGRSAVALMQSLLARSRVRDPVTTALIAAYLGFWAAPLPTAVWLVRRHPEQFRHFVDAYLLLQTTGFLVYFGYPEVPPWLAAQRGYGPPVERTIVTRLERIRAGLGASYARSDPAPLRAMPAMHCAVPALIAASVIAAERGNELSWLSVLYPATVTLAVLALGEHYLVDVVVGIALTLLCFGATEWLNRRPERKA